MSAPGDRLVCASMVVWLALLIQALLPEVGTCSGDGSLAGNCDASTSTPEVSASGCSLTGGSAGQGGAGGESVGASGEGRVAVGRPCGCGEENLDLLACAHEAASSERAAGTPWAEDADSVLVVMHVPREIEQYAQYSVALTAAHLAAFGHGLSLERGDLRKEEAQLDPARNQGSLYRALRVRQLLAVLRRSARPGSGSPAWGWLLLLDADAAIVTDEDVLRRALQSSASARETHVVVCAQGRAGRLLDSGVVLVKNAPWSEGFLAAWLQELSIVEPDVPSLNVDRALAAAVGRARKLGGQQAVVELTAGGLSADLRDHAFASVRAEPVVRVRDTADEVREHFFRAAWNWACRRPGGLWGHAPAVLQRHHREALVAGVRLLLAGARRPLALLLDGWPLERKEHTGAVLDTLAGYASLLDSHGTQDAAEWLGVCVMGYDWAGATEEPGAKLCIEHLREGEA